MSAEKSRRQLVARNVNKVLIKFRDDPLKNEKSQKSIKPKKSQKTE